MLVVPRYVGAGCLTLLLAVTGCSASNTPAPSAAPPCVAEACNGKEVTEIHCERDAVLVAGTDIASDDGAGGRLEIHKSNPSVCPDLYWGWFDPNDDNKKGFSLTIKMGDVTSAAQESEAKNPTVTAWTTVVSDPQPRKELTVCLMSGVINGAKHCISTTPS